MCFLGPRAEISGIFEYLPKVYHYTKKEQILFLEGFQFGWSVMKLTIMTENDPLILLVKFVCLPLVLVSLFVWNMGQRLTSRIYCSNCCLFDSIDHFKKKNLVFCTSDIFVNNNEIHPSFTPKMFLLRFYSQWTKQNKKRAHSVDFDLTYCYQTAGCK